MSVVTEGLCRKDELPFEVVICGGVSPRWLCLWLRYLDWSKDLCRVRQAPLASVVSGIEFLACLHDDALAFALAYKRQDFSLILPASPIDRIRVPKL